MVIRKIAISNIEWDTDGVDPEELALPTGVTIEGNIDEDGVADYLSDMFGYCVKSFVSEYI